VPKRPLEGAVCALRRHLQDGVPLARAASDAGVAVQTEQRSLTRYRARRLAGLVRTSRADTGHRRLPAELPGLIEGLALRKPGPAVSAIDRQALGAAQAGLYGAAHPPDRGPWICSGGAS